MMSNEPDVEYTEVVHPRAADSTKGKHTSKHTLNIYFLSILCLLPLRILLQKPFFASWSTFLNS